MLRAPRIEIVLALAERARVPRSTIPGPDGTVEGVLLLAVNVDAPDMLAASSPTSLVGGVDWRNDVEERLLRDSRELRESRELRLEPELPECTLEMLALSMLPAR